MRTVPVTTETYAAIWAARREGEETEDDVLRRVLGVPPGRRPPEPPAPSNSPPAAPSRAWHHRQLKAPLPEGFEIERTYKGKHYRARVVDGTWRLEGSNRVRPTIRSLGLGIGTGRENAWMNWFYVDAATGERRPISFLRDESTISKRI